MLNLNLNSVSTGGPKGPFPAPPTPVPVVDFSASTTGPTAGNSVTFTDLSTNTPTSWQWSFPGGTPTGSTQQNPTVTYSATGSYNVSLSAGNTGGTGSLTKTNYINVVAAPTPPVETTFTTNGTWSCCPGAVCVEVVAVGAGAGGRSFTGFNQSAPFRQTGAPGGGAGGVVICTLTTGFGSSQCVRIGTGGGSNTAGGGTCFGALVVADGGGVGSVATCASGIGSSTASGGVGGNGSPNGGLGRATADNFGAGNCYLAANAGCAGGAATGKPGAGGAGGGYSQCGGAGYFGCGGAGGAGSTLCGITLGTGGAGGTNCNGTPMPAAGNAASGFGAGGGGAASPDGYCLGTTIAGGAGGNGVLKVIQYFG
jgi:hypothetical protein